MSQMPLSFNADLHVRDADGNYRMADASQILAAARAALDAVMPKGETFTSPRDVEDYLKLKLAGLEHEVFSMILLDTRHRLIEYVELFRGTINGASVYPREVVKTALAHNAAAVIFAHNHPSGIPEPSTADRRLTDRLQEALNLIEVRTLDHIVVGGNKAVSFASRGLI